MFDFMQISFKVNKAPDHRNPLEESRVKRSAAFCPNSSVGNIQSLRFSTVHNAFSGQSFESDSNCSVRLDCDSYMTKVSHQVIQKIRDAYWLWIQVLKL